MLLYQWAQRVEAPSAPAPGQVPVLMLRRAQGWGFSKAAVSCLPAEQAGPLWMELDRSGGGSSSFGAWMTFLYLSPFCSRDAIGLVHAAGSRWLLHTKHSQCGTHPHRCLEPRSDETGQR